MYALHYVFIPRINRSLEQFHLMWNNHGLRTEHGQTPNQILTEGMLHSGTPAVNFLDFIHEHYGEEESISAPNDEGITIPPITVEVSQEQLANLQQINVLEDSS